MEISDKKDIDKLIAVSKSFQVGLIDDNFDADYTPPEKIIEEEESIQEIKLDDFDTNMNDEEMMKLLQANVQSQIKRESVISEVDSLESNEDSEDDIKSQKKEQIIVKANLPIQQPHQKCQTTLDMSELKKVSDEAWKMLSQIQGRKSLLGASIKEKSSSLFIQGNHQITIYFFNTPNKISLSIAKNTTVFQVIKQSIIEYQNNSNFDKKLLKYPGVVEAYEIRIVDDDFEYKAGVFPALDKKKEILSTNTYAFALIECSSYKPTKNEMQMFDKLNENMILIDVTVLENNVNSKIQIEKKAQVADIIERISRKNKKIDTLNYFVQLVEDDCIIDLDHKMPVCSLSNKKLYIKKKVWADQSEQQPQQPRRETISANQETAVGPLNPIQAFRHERFTVVKINERGKRQDRILGIDQFKIFNMNKNENVGIIHKILNNQTTGTKYPERLIEDIVDMRIANQFLYITFRQQNGFKELKFDTLDPRVANKIYNKINSIRAYMDSSKSRTYSQKLE